MRTPPLAEVNVSKLVSTAVAVPQCGGGFLGPERAADALDAAELELLVVVRLAVPRAHAAAGGGVLSAPRDGAPRGRSRACGRVGAPAAVQRRQRSESGKIWSKRA